ncbi:hypothetical protein L596_005190 [Steinernema carpocapsae]|uniref:Uncharacterized protein n=1 Tax=Steinernema carpocapsae TaxID=34508 RepID=A0A4U8UYB1_STECR|nr:hypothetical protein L596_005190 [Steinernema carpocapsae]
MKEVFTNVGSGVENKCSDHDKAARRCLGLLSFSGITKRLAYPGFKERVWFTVSFWSDSTLGFNGIKDLGGRFRCASRE